MPLTPALATPTGNGATGASQRLVIATPEFLPPRPIVEAPEKLENQAAIKTAAIVGTISTTCRYCPPGEASTGRRNDHYARSNGTGTSLRCAPMLHEEIRTVHSLVLLGFSAYLLAFARRARSAGIRVHVIDLVVKPRDFMSALEYGRAGWNHTRLVRGGHAGGPQNNSALCP